MSPVISSSVSRGHTRPKYKTKSADGCSKTPRELVCVCEKDLFNNEYFYEDSQEEAGAYRVALTQLIETDSKEAPFS